MTNNIVQKSHVELKLHLHRASRKGDEPESFGHVYQFCYKPEYLQASTVNVLLWVRH